MSALKLSIREKQFYNAHAARNRKPELTASKEEHQKILDAFGKLIVKTAISTGCAVFPINIWKLKIHKIKRPALDMQATKRLKRKVYTFNDQTDGFIAYYNLLMSRTLSHKKTNYTFQANRYAARQIPATLKKDPKMIYLYEQVMPDMKFDNIQTIQKTKT